MSRRPNHTAAGLGFVLACLLIAFAIYLGMKGGKSASVENAPVNAGSAEVAVVDQNTAAPSDSASPDAARSPEADATAAAVTPDDDKAWTKHANLAALNWSDYPAPQIGGAIVLPDFNGTERAHRDFRSALTDEAKKGVNFAGHYRAAWIGGCGTGCTRSFVIDETTGHIAKTDLSLHGVAVLKDDNDQSGTEDVDFRANSNLVLELAHDTVNGAKTCFFNAYVWTPNGLKQISSAQEPAPDGGNDVMLGDGSYCTPSAPQ